MTELKRRKITQGTKEWADSNVNCFSGCSNDCRYCYAKIMAIRFKRKTNETWKKMIPNQKAINKKYRKKKGRIMFPTSHDITDKSIDQCLIVLKKLLDSGNDVLITTKPKTKCVQRICNELKEFKEQIQFRFTITSLNNRLIHFWEPNAPDFEERYEALKYAYDSRFKTSVSIEPFLDSDPFKLVDKLNKYVTESIWIGKMNYIKNRISGEEIAFYIQARELYTQDNLLKILKKIEKEEYSKVRIKDSIYNYLAKL